MLATVCSVGCAEKRSRLECELQEQGLSGRALTISATLSEPETANDGVRDFEGTIEYRTDSQATKVNAHGSYFDYRSPLGFELVSFSQTGSGKLNITVMPEHAVLKQRGTKAVVMTGNQTVHNGTPATAQCRVLGPA